MKTRRFRNARIMLTVTEEEKRRIEEFADKMDMTTTAYCRSVLLSKHLAPDCKGNENE